MTHISNVTLGHECLDVQWSDGSVSAFDYIWLRDNCPTAFHPQTHERHFNLLSIDEHIRPRQASTNGDTIDITWDNHRSIFQAHWLEKHDYNRSKQAEHKAHIALWRSNFTVPEYDYSQLIDHDQVLLGFLQQLESTGLVFVTSVIAHNGLEQFVKRISHIRETNFGKIFEVMSKPEPNNQAYTANALPLHTDLPNQELIPGYQFLHCISQSTKGGVSLFADGFSAAEWLRTEYPQDFELLCQQDISFRFHDTTHDLKQRKRIISVDNKGEIEQVTFNAHLAEPFDISAELMRKFYRGYKRFMHMVHHEDIMLKCRLAHNSMVVFNNRRVLHGRSAFDPAGGDRHLRGCYIDRADVNSKINVLQRQQTFTK